MNTFHMKIVIFAYLVLIPVIVNSASFNCDKAHTRIETLICGDSDLSILDGLLASNYKTYLKIRKMGEVFLSEITQLFKNTKLGEMN